MLLKRLFLSLILLVVVFFSGVSGYMLIEGWGFLDALFMTVITISTVGYMEVHPLTPTGRIFTVCLIIFGMGILLFGISTFTAFMVEGELSFIIRRKKMDKSISRLKGHYIVCGAGRFGRHIIDELHKTKRIFVVIDRDEEVCKRLGQRGILFVKGDATSTATLSEANAANAKGVFCTFGSNDAENLLLILTAKGLNPRLRIVASAAERESEEKMKKAGADRVVLPEFIGGLRMASEMIRPEAVTFLDQMLKGQEEEYRVEDIPVRPDSVFAGKTLRDSGLLEKEGVTVSAVRKGDKYVFNPSDKITLEVGNALILIGEVNGIRDIKRLAGQI
jgi:voltage-gated potassium channel